MSDQIVNAGVPVFSWYFDTLPQAWENTVSNLFSTGTRIKTEYGELLPVKTGSFLFR